MNRDDYSPTIAVTQEMVASTDSHHGKADPRETGDEFLPRYSRMLRHLPDSNTLDTNEVERLVGGTFDLQAQFDGLANAINQLIQRSRLRVAAMKRRHGGDVESFSISLDHDVEITFHAASKFQLQSLIGNHQRS